MFIYSCDVFPTRQAELPKNNSNNYLLATNQNILIDNFQKSVSSADYNNYANCFSTKSNGQIKEFEFIPSGDINNLYSSLFQNWSYQEEIRNFKSIIGNLNSENKLNLYLLNKEYTDINSDSLVFTSDYELKIETNDEKNSILYNGKLLLNLYRESNGIWFISKWTDLQSSIPDIKTWSNLKVKYSN